MIFVDTNVFVIELRYRADRNASANRRFLRALAEQGDGVTSVINVLETCGVLAFNLNARQLLSLEAYFHQRFRIEVRPRPRGESLVPASAEEIFGYVQRGLSFGDALTAYALGRWAPEAEALVSWDAAHFRGKITAEAMTPTEFLRRS